MAVTLSPARLEDACRLGAMSRDLVEQGLAWKYRPDLIARFMRSKDHEVVVAKDGDRIVGFAIMRFDDDQGHLILFAVVEEARRQGVGRLLMDWLMRMAEVAALQAVHVEMRSSNEGARAFYKSFGFREVALVRGYYEGREHAVRAVLRLGRARNGSQGSRESS